MENLSKPYALRLPIEVAERYENIAASAGTKISTVMRNVLTNGKDVVITQPDPKRQGDRARVMRILGNAGNNLNQIARLSRAIYATAKRCIICISSRILRRNSM